MSEHEKELQAEEIAAAAADTGEDSGENGADGDHAARAEQAEQAAADLREQVLRAAAELENTRRRAARDVENAHRYGVERFAREMLAVVDSLEMGREAARNAGEGGAVAEGMDATLRLLLSVLEKFGVTPVDAAGQPFDPESHEAIMTQPTAEAEPDTVLTVVQPGYRINERLLRPARVIVARAPDE